MPSFLASHQHLFGFVMQVARLCVWLVLLTAVFAPLERFFAVRPAKLFQTGWTTNLGWYCINSLAPIFLLGPPSALIATLLHATLPASITGAGAALPLWARIIAAMVVGEVGFYWGHRWSHEIPLLWRFHAIHHSAEHVNFLVNTRAHPVDMVFTRLCGLVLLYACGLAAPVGPHPALVPALVLVVGSMWAFFIHANLRWRLGPFEELISSPAFHHWHHTRNDHKDHNYLLDAAVHGPGVRHLSPSQASVAGGIRHRRADAAEPRRPIPGTVRHRIMEAADDTAKDRQQFAALGSGSQRLACDKPGSARYRDWDAGVRRGVSHVISIVLDGIRIVRCPRRMRANARNTRRWMRVLSRRFLAMRVFAGDCMGF